jgi:hypothetical protein
MNCFILNSWGGGEDFSQIALVVLMEGRLEKILTRHFISVFNLEFELRLYIDLRVDMDNRLEKFLGFDLDRVEIIFLHQSQ